MNSHESIPTHGGDVIAASMQYGIAVADWLDLSTGLNPDMYPIPAVPDECYQRLPLHGDGRLLNAAKAYYACDHVVAAAGSQRLIQILPALRPRSRVAIPDVGYREHHYHWQRHGHSISDYSAWKPETLSEMIDAGAVDCVVLINPSNPTAVCVDIAQLLQWQKKLAMKGGWLIIDEAFADASPEISFASFSHLPGVIILRSVGKFFGLAGIRVGFALCEKPLAQRMAIELGPWSVAGPAQLIAAHALHNHAWQKKMRGVLLDNSQWMFDQLQAYFDRHILQIASTRLFVSVTLASELAKAVYVAMAERGILIRYWPIPTQNNKYALLRFGLLSQSDRVSRQRFQSALSEVLSCVQVFSIM
ncbi:aminotransferase class I/II-fold pyridoxal phosphate-dependent enzyme [bacterium AH-315-K03]|nr:aminotransferase class I/II-fold pyridoxal phosphate-dependent enzyme [bacterium AH-315-K03]